MGYDTIRLRSPYLGHGVVGRIKRQCLLRSGLGYTSGEILYELFIGELLGSRDSRILVIPRNEEWVVNKNGRPELMSCDLYILIEASTHKIKYGHDVYDTPNMFLGACRDFVALVEDLLETDLPVADWWTVHRVNVASVHRLSETACKELSDGLQLMSFPCRRKGAVRYAMAVYSTGKMMTVKFYHKGTEFQVHDRGRLRGFFLQVFKHQHEHDEECNRALIGRKVTAFQHLVDSRLRVEVEVRSDKLQYNFGKRPQVGEVTDAHLEGVFDTEIEKLLRERKQATTTVRENRAVLHRLKDVYGDSTGTRLCGFWSSLCILGDEVTREYFAKMVFYRNRKQLEDAGVSRQDTDVLIIANTMLPYDFSSIRADPRLRHPPVRDREEFQMSREVLRFAA